MIDHNSPESVIARSNQEDPIVMYLIVRESLEMSVGKTAAQCAHASQMLQLKYNQLEKELYTDKDFLDKIYIFREWLNSSFRKVVLRSDNGSWEKIKAAFKDQNMIVVIDSGLTEIPSGSETVIGLWPIKKSQRPKLIKKLQALK